MKTRAYQFAAPSGIKKDNIVATFLPNHHIEHITRLGDIFLSELGVTHPDKNEYYDIELHEFKTAFIHLMNLEDSDIVSFEEILDNSLAHWECTIHSNEHDFKVIRANAYQLKNYFLYIIKTFVNQTFLLDTLQNNLENQNPKMVYTDLKTHDEIRYSLLLGNLFVIIPFARTDAGIINKVPFVDLTCFNENGYINKLCDHLFVQFENSGEFQNILEETVNPQVIGAYMEADPVYELDKPINVLFVDIEQLSHISSIEAELFNDYELNFVRYTNTIKTNSNTNN